MAVSSSKEESPPPETEAEYVCWDLNVKDLIIPKLNTDEDDSPLTLLRFVEEFKPHMRHTPGKVKSLLQVALQGHKEKRWFIELGGDPQLVMDKIAREANKSEQWQALTSKVMRGERLHPDIEEHIRIFKRVVEHAEWNLEGAQTRELFVRTIPHLQAVATCVINEKGELKSFGDLESAARSAEAIMKFCAKKGEANVAEAEQGSEEEEAAYAAKMKRGKKRNIICKRCGKRGHRAEECRAPHPITCKRCGKAGHRAEVCRAPHPIPQTARSPNSKLQYVGLVEGQIQRQSVTIGSKRFSCIVDTGASLNIITKAAARRIRNKAMAQTNTTVHTLDSEIQIKQTIQTEIEIGNTKATVVLHVAPKAPADILLGVPFLQEHSQGYKLMCKEFEQRTKPQTVASAETTVDKPKTLEDVLACHPDLILEPDQVPDPTRVYKGQHFRLGLPDDKRSKIYCRPQYPPKPGDVEAFRKVLEPLIKAGVYQISNSPHNSPAMLVPKKKPGDFRMVVDSRQVNQACSPVGGMAAAPLDIIKSINGAKIFTTLDCKNAFYSLVLDEQDRPFTAISPPGMPKLELTRMPMGAKASTAALFQAMMATLGNAVYTYALVWADDVIVYSKNYEEHVRHLEDVLNKLDQNGFCISRDKIELGKDKVKWLGYEISAKGVKPDPEKVEKLTQMRRPQTLKELRSALGMWTYFSKFIPAYSIIAAPLMSQLKKENKTLNWTDDCEKAWETIKQKICVAPIMGYCNYDQPLQLHTDACQSGFAAILTQIQGNRNVLIDAISRTTNAAEKNYSSAKLECACVIWAAKRWKSYINAVPNTEIVTDSYGLQYLHQKSSDSALVQRWIMEMDGLRCTVRYHKGKENIADFLSRQDDRQAHMAAAVTTRSATSKQKRPDYRALNGDRPKRVAEPTKARQPRKKKQNTKKQSETSQQGQPADQTQELQQNQMQPTNDDMLIKAQHDDSNIQRIWEISQGKDVYQPSAKELQDAKDLVMKHGIVMKNVPHSSGQIISKIVVPLSLQKKIVQEAHQKSHGGLKETYEETRRYHWFRNMKQVIREVVSNCEQCLARKGRPLTREVLAPDERPLELGGRWHIDGLAMPETTDGFDHLIVAVDAATKYVILRPAKGESSAVAAETLMDIIRRFGRPQEITTDRGRAFMSNRFMAICKAFHIVFKPTAQGQPQADGMVERVNRTILDIAAFICKEDNAKWNEHVGEIEYAANTRTSSTTKYTPYELVYGRQPPGPTYSDPTDPDISRSTGEQLRILRRRIEVLQQLAHENQMLAAKQQKSFHDAKAEQHKFEVGDKVWLYKPSQAERGVTSKLAFKWSGPYTVSKEIGPVTFILKDKDGKELPGTAHARFMHRQGDPQGERGGRCHAPDVI